MGRSLDLLELLLVGSITIWCENVSAFQPFHSDTGKRDASLHVVHPHSNFEGFESSSLLSVLPDALDLPGDSAGSGPSTPWAEMKMTPPAVLDIPPPSLPLGTVSNFMEDFRDEYYKPEEISKALVDLQNTLSASRSSFDHLDERIAQSAEDILLKIEKLGLNPENIRAFVNLEKNGGWYLFSLIMFLVTVLGSSRTTERHRTAELAIELEIEKESFENQILELTSTTESLSKELKQLRIDMTSLRTDLDAQKSLEKELRAETAELEAALKEKDQHEKTLKLQIKDLEAKVNDNTNEKLLRQQIEDLKIQLDAEKLKTKTSSAPKKETIPDLEVAAAPIAPEPKEMNGTFFADIEESIETIDSVTQSPAPPKAKSAKKTKSTSAQSKGKTKVVTKVTETDKVTKSNKVSSTSESDQEAFDNWVNLSPSALKRKTVKALIAYLESKVRVAKRPLSE